LGDKAAALALSDRAIAANPIEQNAVTGPVPIEVLARVTARMGEPDRAISVLQKLLSIPYSGAFAFGVPLTPALLRLDPMFDPLRNDPRFQKLVASEVKLGRFVGRHCETGAGCGIGRRLPIPSTRHRNHRENVSRSPAKPI
ncbi:MAG: hypothetical protein DME53_01265, partial [Verrucomicrobia bacterium]